MQSRKVRIVSEAPRIERMRHELRHRTLRVSRIERVAPRMARIAFTGDDLQGFTSLGFDDHVKLFFPPGSPDGSAADAAGGTTPIAAPEVRDFTPRKYDAQAGELWIDFHLHARGPAALWAQRATVGQALDIAGPKGSSIIHLDGIDCHVLIGDESALPAISRRLEELPASSRAIVLLELDHEDDKPQLGSRASLQMHTVTRSSRGAEPAHEIIRALRELQLPSDRCFVWIAMESHGARALRRYLRVERGIGGNWIKAAGYWQQGKSGRHEPVADES